LLFFKQENKVFSLLAASNPPAGCLPPNKAKAVRTVDFQPQFEQMLTNAATRKPGVSCL